MKNKKPIYIECEDKLEYHKVLKDFLKKGWAWGEVKDARSLIDNYLESNKSRFFKTHNVLLKYNKSIKWEFISSRSKVTSITGFVGETHIIKAKDYLKDPKRIKELITLSKL